MDDCIASYECLVSGWKWTYQLFPDRLIANAKGRVTRYEIELKDCDELVDRGVTAHTVKYSRRFWTVGWSVIFATALLFAAVISVLIGLEIRLPGNHVGKELIPVAVSVVIIETLTMIFFVPFLTQETRTQRYVSLKRASDGSVLIYLNSAVDPIADNWDEFVAELEAAIRRVHLGASPPESIQDMQAAGVARASSLETDLPLSVFETTDSGWHWTFTLVPYRLLMKGRRARKGKKHPSSSAFATWFRSAVKRRFAKCLAQVDLPPSSP